MTTTENVGPGQVIQIGEYRILMIERIRIDYEIGERSGWCHGGKEIVAIVAQAQNRTHAYDCEAGLLTLDECTNRFPLWRSWLRQAGV